MSEYEQRVFCGCGRSFEGKYRTSPCPSCGERMDNFFHAMRPINATSRVVRRKTLPMKKWWNFFAVEWAWEDTDGNLFREGEPHKRGGGG